MKIAIIGTRGIPATYGGFETNVEQTAPFLAQNKIETWVYCRPAKNQEKMPKYKGVNLVYLKTANIKNISTFWHTFVSLIHACRNKFDLIHLYNVGNAPLLIIPKIFGIKTIISVDGMDWKRRKYNFIEKNLVKLCAFISPKLSSEAIVDSKYVGNFYKNKFNAVTTFLPYGGKIIKKSPPKKILKELKLNPKKYLLFVGRFVPEKNIPSLIEAFKKADLGDFKLVIVGTTLNTKYREKIHSLKNENIIMPGFITGSDLDALYKNAYLYITPSELEGTSPSLLQAMGAGTAVIVNGIGENIETIGKAGLFYKKNNLVDLTKQIEKLVYNSKLRDEIAKKCQARVEKFYTWDRIRKQYLDIILKYKP